MIGALADRIARSVLGRALIGALALLAAGALLVARLIARGRRHERADRERRDLRDHVKTRNKIDDATSTIPEPDAARERLLRFSSRRAGKR